MRWPKKRMDKHIVLEHLASFFETTKRYSETEVNEIIRNQVAIEDFPLLRRELIDNAYLNRTPDCREYWREEK